MSSYYARAGVYDPDYCSDVPNVDFTAVPFAYDSDAPTESDRGAFPGTSQADGLADSDRAGLAYTADTVFPIYTHTRMLMVYRRSAHRHLRGFAGSKFNVRTSDGVGAASPTTKSTAVQTLATATTTTVNLALPITTTTDFVLAYGTARAGILIRGRQDFLPVSERAHSGFRARHDIGGEAPQILWSLDQMYELQSDAPQPIEWALDQEYALVFPIPEWSLDSQWSQLAYQEVEWSLDSEWSMGISEWTLDFTAAVTGASILTDFVVLLNGLRASLGLPTFAICTRPVRDIAQLHSENQARLRLQYHDHPSFPPGQRTYEERLALIEPGLAGAENIVSITTVKNSAETVTGADIYEAWLDSPPHYAIMVNDFGVDGVLELQVGMEPYVPYVELDDGQYGPYENRYFNIVTLALINFNPARVTVPVEFLLNSQYSLQTPTRENFDMAWGTFTYVPVRRRFTSPYSAVVTATHSSPYGVYVSAAHTAVLQYSLQVDFASPYGSTVPAAAQHVASYDIEEYAKVRTAHASSWAMARVFTHTLAYNDSAVVRAASIAVYSDKDVVVAGFTATYTEASQVRASIRAPYGDATPVRNAHTSPYALIKYVVTGHTAAYGDQVPVQVSQMCPFDMLDYDPVKATLRSSYAISAGDTISIGEGYSVLLDGIEIDCNSLALEMDEGEPYWTGTVDLVSTAVFAAIQPGQSLLIDFYGEIFDLVIDSKNIGRESPVDISMTVTAFSPIALKDTPYASPIDRTQETAIMARDLVEELLGQSVAWEIHDWLILPYRFAVTQRSPLAAARLVVEAAGGVLKSRPDGSLVAAYRFPVALPSYDSTEPDISVSDTENNLTYTGRFQSVEVYNEFRVRDTAGYQTDYFEWTPDEGSNDSGTLRAYVMPWRPAVVEVRHTSENAVATTFLGVEYREETKEVEIVNGTGQLPYPAVNILHVEWLSASLGSVYLEPRTKEVKIPNPTANWGYGLAKITYGVECLKYYVQAPTGVSVQYILIDSGA